MNRFVLHYQTFICYLPRNTYTCYCTVVYYLGEKLAYGFGITTPDWQYAIDIYEDMQREEQEEREAEEQALQEQQRRLLLKMRKMEDQRTASEEGDS